MKKLLLLFLIIGTQSLTSQSFYEDFSFNNYNWSTQSRTQEFSYSNGRIDIYQVRNENGYSAGNLVHNTSIDHTRDFKITGNMRLVKGSTGNGLVWNVESAETNYRFLITDRDGQYAIYKMENTKPVVVKKWGKSEYINKKFSWNELSVEKRGSRTYFYINGYEVYNTYLSYNSYPKQVGIFLGNGSSVLSGLTVEDFRLEYSGGNSNNGDGEQDRAPGKY